MYRIDFHAHILPGADHGSHSLETSLAQLALAEKADIDIIVATSHFYPDTHGSATFFERRENAYRELSEHYDGNIEIYRGAEVFLCEGLNNFDRLDELCVEGTNTILIEMPNAPWNERLLRSLSAIVTDRKLRVVLAHVERYPAGYMELLLKSGYEAQVNAESFTRLMLRGRLLKWIDKYNVAALGSDIHGESDAYQAYKKAESILGERYNRLTDIMNELITK